MGRTTGLVSLTHMGNFPTSYCALAALFLIAIPASAERKKYLGIQHEENPPMKVIGAAPPDPKPAPENFPTRPGFKIIQSLEEFRKVMKADGQKIRLAPGIYTAKTIDKPVDGNHSIFAVTGSDNYFDLRGATIITPVSVQGKLPGKAHVSDCWVVLGNNNTFDGGYFRNEVDKPYPNYRVADNEFEIHGSGNTFKNCTYLLRGSVPFGYTDFFGKGSGNYGRLDKHSFMSLNRAKNTKLIGCKIYMQSFGHALHLHEADGVYVKDCHISGILRPTNDIFQEKVGRAKDNDFHMLYRKHQPIPKDEIIPLSEDGIRTYGGDRDITIIDTTIERMRGNIQIHAAGKVTLKNVTIREAGDFGLDVSAVDGGKVVVENCRIDTTYRPALYLKRGPVPKDASYDVTIIDHSKNRIKAEQGSLGLICGEDCTFILRDGTTRSLPEEANVLICGDKRRPLINSTVENHTTAKIILTRDVSNCRVESVGPVEDNGENNTIVELEE